MLYDLNTCKFIQLCFKVQNMIVNIPYAFENNLYAAVGRSAMLID